MIDIKDIYLVAGFLDGEGSFTLSGHCHRIGAVSTDLDLIQICMNRMMIHKRAYKMKRREICLKSQYYFRINSRQAVGWIMTLYPLLCNRRKNKIREIIAVWKSGRKVKNNVR